MNEAKISDIVAALISGWRSMGVPARLRFADMQIKEIEAIGPQGASLAAYWRGYRDRLTEPSPAPIDDESYITGWNDAADYLDETARQIFDV